VADVKPFRAVRYAHPTPAVTAPPYDVIGPAERDRYLSLDPHNVVHLTLGTSEEEAGRLFRTWLADGVLIEEDESAVWAVEQRYVGPDGVERTRGGLVASLRVEPYSARIVLPHERTHAGPKESRLKLLRAAQAQLEPIFLLYDGEPPVSRPDSPPDLEAAGTRLWRVSADAVPAYFVDRQLLIADGHHRYETALAYAEESGADRMMVVLVSTADPGLEVFPTHRVFAGRADIEPAGDPQPDVATALARLAGEGYERSFAVFLDRRGPVLVRGEAGELDVELVDRYGHDGISYTPDAEEAARAVEAGEATCAFLLRATRTSDIFERARDGDVMPQKTTYFFPKLTSGLLFHPVS
jgi:uncharacterized protein (DUF1015 family)